MGGETERTDGHVWKGLQQEKEEAGWQGKKGKPILRNHLLFIVIYSVYWEVKALGF